MKLIKTFEGGNDMLAIGTKLIKTSNPEWGYWAIMSHYSESIYEIRGNSGERILGVSELERFWGVLN